MKILHLTPSSEGYEEVTLLANRYSKTNQLAVIEQDGEKFLTGGLLIEDTPQIRDLLDRIDKEKQYEFFLSLRQKPFVKDYYEV
jgi:hypothetical protein